MTKKTHAELKKRSRPELEKALSDARMEQIKLNAQVSAGGAAKEAGKVTRLRRRVARIQTLLNQGGKDEA